MPKVKLYNVEGKAVGEKELRADVFGVAANQSVIHEVMVGIAASARQPLAHTKTRGDVRGGGKKPWKQKGTGRARSGSSRSPVWVGGGITFGPRSERDYTKKINRKLKRQALAMTLSDKVANDRLVLVEAFSAKNGKTKEVATVIGKLPVKGKLAVISAGKDEMLSRATYNLPNVHLVGAGTLSIMDVLKSDYVVTTPEATDKISAMFGKAN